METRIEQNHVAALVNVILKGYPHCRQDLRQFSEKILSEHIVIDIDSSKSTKTILNKIIYSFIRTNDENATYESIARVFDDLGLGSLSDQVLREKERVDNLQRSVSSHVSSSSSIRRFEESDISEIRRYLLANEKFCCNIQKFAIALQIPENDLAQIMSYDPKQKLNRILYTLYQKFPSKASFNHLGLMLGKIGLEQLQTDFLTRFNVDLVLTPIRSGERGRIQIHDRDTNKSYENVFGRFLHEDVTEVVIEDPYLRKDCQLNDLEIFLELVKLKCPQIRIIEVVTDVDDRTDEKTIARRESQTKALQGIQRKMHYLEKRINFRLTFRKIHDRKLKMYDSQGWYYLNLGKGLSYFDVVSDKDLPEWKDQNLRKCQETEIQYEYITK